jgi:competence protein ComEC
MRSPRLSLPVLVGIATVVALAIPRSDAIRERAEAGLGRGMPPREAALARGFVLGDDEGIDAKTTEDFRRAGLSHLLAVSGQNVTLLALLAMPLLAALGVPLRERLVWVLALIAVYVPLVGAGPTVQCAAVMGAAGVLATLAGRRAPRLHGLALALGVTLAIDPSIAADVGWQLSFTAVLGILLLAAPLRRALVARLGRGALRGALAEGIAVTVAATLATAPLIAFHFERLSTTTLLANVAAMPAVAPAMWLGMASAAASQLPGAPVEPLNGLAALLLAYVAQVAAWCAAPGWAELDVRLGPGGLVASYLALGAAVIACHRLARHRRLASLRHSQGHDPRTPHNPCGRTSSRIPGTSATSTVQRVGWVLGAVACCAVGAALWVGGAGGEGGARPDAGVGLRVEVIDVGQGDAILLQPADAAAVLVDTGPPGAGLVAELSTAGVDRLGAVVVTHDQSDHTGGLVELLDEVPVERLIYARLDRGLLALARAQGAAPVRLAAGGVLRSGRLSLQVLWPPPELLSSPLGSTDPNQQALVLLARWRDFSILLSADAEAEAVPIDPGPVDVLKVAHHGSADAGLAALLARVRPRLAVISVGMDNPYGHPAPATLATLAAHGARILRTDRVGDVLLDVRPRSVAVRRDG